MPCSSVSIVNFEQANVGWIIIAIFCLPLLWLMFNSHRNQLIHGFTISVPLLILPIFRRLLPRNGKISSKCFETTEHSVQTADDDSKLTSNFSIIKFQIRIIS